MKRVFLATLLSLLVATVGFADAPETGNVQGKVTDASGPALPGVTITLEGPRGSQAAISQDGGAYRFALLPPGEYKIKAELEGFQATEASTTVTAGRTTEVNLRLTLGTSEEITVTSEAPMVDKFNVTAGSTVTSEVGQEVAGSTRTYYGVINTLPGVSSDGDNNDIDIIAARPGIAFNGLQISFMSSGEEGTNATAEYHAGNKTLTITIDDEANGRTVVEAINHAQEDFIAGFDYEEELAALGEYGPDPRFGFWDTYQQARNIRLTLKLEF